MWKKQNKTNIIITVIIMVIIIIIGIVFVSSKKNTIHEDNIKIGAIYSLTGPGSFFGQESANGAKIAVDKLNENGGIYGKQIKLIIEDSASDPKTAISAFNKLKDVDNVKIIITSSSGISMSLLPLAKESGILLFADASHPAITNPSHPLIFRHADTVKTNADLIGKFVKEKKCAKIGLLYSNDDYGLASYNEFNNAISISIAESFDINTPDSRSQISKLLSIKPDCVVVAGFGSAYNNIFKELYEFKYDKNIVTTMGFILSNTKSLGKIVDGVYYLEFELNKNSKEYNSFVTKYKTEYGANPSWAFTTYDDIYIIAEAIKKSGSDDPLKISQAIKDSELFSSGFEDLKISESGDIPYNTKIIQFNYQK